jgi:hypothetical protein
MLVIYIYVCVCVCLHVRSADISFWHSWCFWCLVQQVLTQVLEEAGYTKDSSLVLSDFMKVCVILL